MKKDISKIVQYLKSKDVIDFNKVSFLGRGHVNDNYLIEAKDDKFVLRLRRGDIPKEKSNLSNEYKIYRFLEYKKYQWVPRPIFFDEEKPALIITFVPGKVTNIKRLSPRRLESLAARIAEYHSYTFRDFVQFCTKNSFSYSEPVTPQEDFERFELKRFNYIKEHLKDKEWITWLEARLEEYKWLVDEFPLGETNLIHGDIYGNTLHDGKGNFWLIDWEQGRFSYYDDLGHILGGITSIKDMDPIKTQLYLKYAKKDMETLKIEVTKSRYFKYVTSAIWALHRYTKMKEEGLLNAKVYYNKAVKCRQGFEKDIKKD